MVNLLAIDMLPTMRQHDVPLSRRGKEKQMRTRIAAVAGSAAAAALPAVSTAAPAVTAASSHVRPAIYYEG